MNTPTPRTDERKASFALDTIRQLETELATVGVIGSDPLLALRSDVSRLRAEVDALHQPMQDAERAYWAADLAWREKAWQLFAVENPDLDKLALEAKAHEKAWLDLKRKVTETAKERGASLPSGFWG